MGTKSTTSLVIFVAFYIIFFSQVCTCGDSTKPWSPKPTPPPPPPRTHISTPPPPPPPPKQKPTPPPPSPIQTPPPPTPVQTCPIDILNLAVCASLLNITGVPIGSPQAEPCCSLIDGLLDLEAAACLCLAIKANILGIILDIQVALNLILNDCGKKVPMGFKCA